MIKIEMHSHTYFSGDGFITPRSIAKQCLKKQLDCVCITDHNSIHGAVEFAKQVPVKIIIGEEVQTGQGDLIGLFITEKIPPMLGLKITAEKIKEQGGLVYLPHPFDNFRKSAVKRNDAEKIVQYFDIIEVFNSRTFNPKYNKMAEQFATEYSICTAVGSDAHHPFEIGNSYMCMDNFEGPQSFLENLRRATYIAKPCSFLLRLYIKGLKILKGKD
ncbi:MAG: PHP domain-containing protein [Pseudomonadota bacterium]